jgi:hypothetical protein
MKLSNILFRAIFLVAFISILIAFTVSLIFQYNTYITDSNYIRQEFLHAKKEILRYETQKIFQYIRYKQKSMDYFTKATLEERVETAHKIAMAIYNENKTKKVIWRFNT